MVVGGQKHKECSVDDGEGQQGRHDGIVDCQTILDELGMYWTMKRTWQCDEERWLKNTRFTPCNLSREERWLKNTRFAPCNLLLIVCCGVCMLTK